MSERRGGRINCQETKARPQNPHHSMYYSAADQERSQACSGAAMDMTNTFPFPLHAFLSVRPTGSTRKP